MPLLPQNSNSQAKEQDEIVSPTSLVKKEVGELREDEILVRDEKGEFKILKGSSFSPADLENFENKKTPIALTSEIPAYKDQVKDFFQASSQPMTKPLADFYFSYEDKEEIEKLKNGIQMEKDYSYDLLAEEMLAKIDLILVDEVLKKRLKNIIISYLRDIRDELEAKRTLLRGIPQGGLGLETETVDKIFEILKEKKQELFKYKKKEILSEERGDETKKEESPEQKTEGQEKPLLEAPQEKPQFLASPAIPSQTSPEITKPVKSAVELSKKIIPQAIPQISEPVSTVVNKRPIFEDNHKVKIEDIKFIPHLVGPIEELKSLNLVDFRRLADNPSLRMEKIQKKLDLLEEDSFSQRILGIKAWQESEVFRLYQKLVRESLTQARTLEEVTRRREEENKPILTEAEFRALMEFNKQIRF